MGPLAVIERWFEEVWNASRREAVGELFAVDGLVTGIGPEPARGPEAFLPVYDAWLASFKDFRFTILQGFEHGDWATARVQGAFTHKASGRALTAEGLVLARVKDGVIVEAHNGFDFGAIVERAGVFPGGSLMAVLGGGRVFEAPDRNAFLKGRVRRIVDEVFNGKQFDKVAEFCHPDCQGFDPALEAPMTGVETIQQVLEAYASGFPGSRYEIEDLIAEGDKVAFRFVIKATHSARFKDLEPTGKTLEVQGNAIVEFEDDKVRRIWQHWDTMGFAARLGLITPPEAALM